MNLNFIKYDGSKVELKWQAEGAEGSLEDHELKSPDEPLDSFKEAFSALKPQALKVCEVPSEYGKTAELRRVKFSRNEDGGMDVQLHLVKVLQARNKPLNIHAPKGEAGDRTEALVDALCEEAVRYARGERKQGKLEFPQHAGDGASEEAQPEAVPSVEPPESAPAQPQDEAGEEPPPRLHETVEEDPDAAEEGEKLPPIRA